MNYFLVEAYGNWGDYEFLVFADTKEQAQELWEAQNEEQDVKFYRAYGPHKLGPGEVIMTRQPE